jgi:hypothetical protein
MRPHLLACPYRRPTIASIIVPFTTPTAPGTLDLTSAALNSQTPVAALFVATGVAPGTRSVDAANVDQVFGATDGSSQWTASYSAFGQGTAGGTGKNPTGYRSTSKVLHCAHHDGTVKYSATLAAVIPGGVRLNFTAVSAVGYAGYVILLTSPTAQAKVGFVTGVSSSGVSTNCGFRPDAVLAVLCGTTADQSLDTPTMGDQGNRGFLGMAVDGSAVGPLCVAWSGSRNAGLGGNPQPSYFDNANIGAHVTGGSGGAVTARIGIGFGVSGFTLTEAAGGADVTAAKYFYLALKMPECVFDLRQQTQPSAVGVQAFAPANGLTEPLLAFHASGWMAAANTYDILSKETVGFTAADPAGTVQSISATFSPGGANGYVSMSHANTGHYVVTPASAVAVSSVFDAAPVSLAAGTESVNVAASDALGHLMATLYIGKR